MLNALMRTLVPAIYGYLVHLGIAHGTTAPQWAVNLISLGLLAAVYLALRAAEDHWKWFGILLGWVGAPSYDDQKLKDEAAQAQAALANQIKDMLGFIVGAVVSEVEQVVAKHATAQTAAVTAQSAVQTAAIAELAETVKKPPAKPAAKKAPAKRAAKKAAPKPSE